MCHLVTLYWELIGDFALELMSRLLQMSKLGNRNISALVEIVPEVSHSTGQRGDNAISQQGPARESNGKATSRRRQELRSLNFSFVFRRFPA
jgi:hypothetical protein